MGEYLIQNKSTKLSKIISSIRSQTFDIKTWNQWKYDDNACVACNINEENMDHFMICNSYENCVEGNNWKIIFENNTLKQFEIAKIAQVRMQKRLQIMENQEAGLTFQSSSTAPGDR